MREGKLKNPAFLLLVGLCPVAAVTDRLSTSLVMAACALVVLFFTSLSLSVPRSLIPEGFRRSVSLVVAGLWVALLDWLLATFLPEVRASLGIYLPLLALSCLVLTHGSRFASSHPPDQALARGLRLAAGFALALVLMAVVREPLGHGTFTLFTLGPLAGSLRIPFLYDHPLGIVAAPAGSLIVLGYWAALFSLLRDARDGREEEQ